MSRIICNSSTCTVKVHLCAKHVLDPAISCSPKPLKNGLFLFKHFQFTEIAYLEDASWSSCLHGQWFQR